VTDPADFLSRWSRRKRASAATVRARSGGRKSCRSCAGIEIGRQVPMQSPASQERNRNSRALPKSKPEEPAFDISQLPPIESITAETDIRAFLDARACRPRNAPGRAAPGLVRRSERSATSSRSPRTKWISTRQREILGFDFSAPSGDIKRMAADIYGKLPASESEANAQPATTPAHEAVPAEFPTERSIASHHNVTGTFSRSERR
jgi:hypothetical protein